MSKRVLCKFFVHGACLKGDRCEFSHDWKDQTNNICTFYQKGVCSYGSRCRYEHVKPSRLQTTISSSSTNSLRKKASGPVEITGPRVLTTVDASPISVLPPELSALSKPFFPPAYTQESTDQNLPDDGFLGELANVDPADRPICAFAAAGDCPRAEKCPHIHGDLCPTCGKHCLHPYRHDEREENILMCERKKRQLDALKNSQDIECSVCLDRVLSKPTAAERRFGLLSECNHPFCISCIRNWRSNSPTSGMDINSALRACPICRKLSYYVILSVIWYFSQEEKQEIVGNYKARLRYSTHWTVLVQYPRNLITLEESTICCQKQRLNLCCFISPYNMPRDTHKPLRYVLDASQGILLGEIVKQQRFNLLYYRSIDCRYFDFGNGSCPFGTSCFYKHAYRDGRLEEVSLRHLGAEDGNTVIAKDIRLSDFLSNLRLR